METVEWERPENHILKILKRGNVGMSGCRVVTVPRGYRSNKINESAFACTGLTF